MSRTICPEELCTGCAACFNVCPHDSIQMVSDAEGFLRPRIDTESCDECGTCSHVCPMLHLKEPDPSATPQVYACWNKNEEVRFQSASGGAFSAFAETVLDAGGVVFGAAFDESMTLRHVAVQRKEELAKLRSSKYVQSDVGRCYGEVRKLLQQGRTVLFAGTPCQVAALQAVVGKGHEQVYTCDMLCHGVPSPGLFARYLQFLEKRYRSKLININVRHKLRGWELPSTVALFRDGQERVLTGYDDSFIYGFINCFSLRPTCYRCPYTNVDRCGDITMGDFWGIGNVAPFKHQTRNGVSLILVHSEKGRRLFGESGKRLYIEERTLAEAKHKRPKLSHPLPKPRKRDEFYSDYQRLEYEDLARIHLVDKGLKGAIKRVVPRTWLFQIRKQLSKIKQ